MAGHPTPDRPGHYWAKLVHPSRMPEGEDWRSVHWEVVQVDVNDPDGKPGEREYLMVLVPGIEPCQWVEDFVWGPRVDDVPSFTGRKADRPAAALGVRGHVWRPLDEAPQGDPDDELLGLWWDIDGKPNRILIHYAPGNERSNRGFIGQHGTLYTDGSITHWMPLPDIPPGLAPATPEAQDNG